MNYTILISAFLLSLVLTLILTVIFQFLGEKGLLGNLFTSVRGGIPRGLGLIPYILLGTFLPPGFNDLVLIIGFFAFLDDLTGRLKIPRLPIEWGQLFRGIGMLLVMIVGFPALGFSSILIALLIQPINISDMQPGTTSSVVIIMSVFVAIAMILLKTTPLNGFSAFYVPLIILAICIGYSPLDYRGNIMMGEVGNHSFAIALGLSFYILGGFWMTLILLFVTTALIAFIRKNNLKKFFIESLKLLNPTPGDYFMDVLTGGGLGDLIRKIFLGKKQIIVRNPLLILLGFRRLLYNPFSPNYKEYILNKNSSTKTLHRK